MLDRRISIAAIALVLVGAFALPSTVTQKPTASDNTNTTYTFTVKATGTENITDFHIDPPSSPAPKVKGTPGTPTSGTPPVALPGWTGKVSGGSINWKCNTPSQAITSSTGEVTFTITIPNNQLNDGLVRWRTTGGTNDQTLDHGPNQNDPSTHGPLSSVTIGPTTARTGTATTISIASTEPSRPYTLYAVSTASYDAPNPWSNNTGFVQWVNDHPVDPAWGLSFQNMTGTLDSNGHSSSPSVTIPNDSNLIGNHFFLIAVVDSQIDDDEVSYKIRSSDLQVAIVSP
jgi:hypothetical protein